MFVSRTIVDLNSGKRRKLSIKMAAAHPSAAPIHVIQRVWERIAPLRLAEKSWDNVGVIIEAPSPDSSHKQVLLTIDLTTAYVSPSKSKARLIKFSSPDIQSAQVRLAQYPLEASLLRLSAHGISVFTPHTSLDATPDGLNSWLVKPFETNTSSSKPITHSEHIQGFEGAGIGKIVKLTKSLRTSRIVEVVKEHLSLKHVQLATPREDPEINSIAVCAGSGASVLKGVQADLLLTGEMSHHEVLAFVAAGQSLILCNHTNTERPYLSQVLRPRLEDELNAESDSGWEVMVSKVDAEPLRTV
ncbi:MAG: hypothetical protein TREMPRED_001847 [Tremellales sp. Tagirdzhanova-0007]|nr:MAG: hypothetical protein TREMPRED_001847 [Tremellales sp. Tagirdzhanova-0007]